MNIISFSCTFRVYIRLLYVGIASALAYDCSYDIEHIPYRHGTMVCHTVVNTR